MEFNPESLIVGNEFWIDNLHYEITGKRQTPSGQMLTCTITGKKVRRGVEIHSSAFKGLL